jgi:hypothetical protein
VDAKDRALDEEQELAELRRSIAEGIEQADRGEVEPLDPLATLGRVRNRRRANEPRTE